MKWNRILRACFWLLLLFLLLKATLMVSNYIRDQWHVPTFPLRTFNIIIVSIVTYLVLKKILRAFWSVLPGGTRGRPLEIMDPPTPVFKTTLGRSRIEPSEFKQINTGTVVFVTHNASIQHLSGPKNSDSHSTVLSDGGTEERRDTPTSYEIHIYFSLHNCTDAFLSIYDIHARLYHVSAGYTPLTIGYVSRYRVDLSQDNSILKAGRVYRAGPKGSLFFDLAFETYLYDDTGTTLAVFGIDLDYELLSGNKVIKYRIPSEKIYVLQHWGPPYHGGSNKVFITPMDDVYISNKYEKVKDKVYIMPDTAAAQTLDQAVKYECLKEMLHLHLDRGIEVLQ
jgi:hypothetical protein